MPAGYSGRLNPIGPHAHPGSTQAPHCGRDRGRDRQELCRRHFDDFAATLIRSVRHGVTMLGGNEMRKLLLLVIASVMLIGGLYALVVELWFANVIFLRFVIGGALIALAGAYLIWTDFLAPRLGLKTWED
jgi:hypothetical protein